jgi:hypothetical protein
MIEKSKINHRSHDYINNPDLQCAYCIKDRQKTYSEKIRQTHRNRYYRRIRQNVRSNVAIRRNSNITLNRRRSDIITNLSARSHNEFTRLEEERQNILSNVAIRRHSEIITNLYDEYAILSRLEDVQIGLTQYEIDNYTLIKDTLHESDLTKQCVICQDNYKITDKMRYLPCFHNFHPECIDQYFESSKRCPLCKIDITTNII